MQWIGNERISSQETVRLLNTAVYSLTESARYHEAELLLRRALTIGISGLGMRHPDTATSLNNLASLSERQGKYERAEQFYQRALDIHEQVLGADHLSTASSLNSLGMLYNRQGNYAKAEPFPRRRHFGSGKHTKSVARQRLLEDLPR